MIKLMDQIFAWIAWCLIACMDWIARSRNNLKCLSDQTNTEIVLLQLQVQAAKPYNWILMNWNWNHLPQGRVAGSQGWRHRSAAARCVSGQIRSVDHAVTGLWKLGTMEQTPQQAVTRFSEVANTKGHRADCIHVLGSLPPWINKLLKLS